MIIIFALIMIFLVIFMWTYLVSINFFWWDFINMYGSIISSDIINERNMELLPKYVQYYNTDWWEGDYYCNWVDNDCNFRNVYWFLPPNITVDIWNFENLKWSWFVFNFTWDLSKWVKIWVFDMWWNYSITDVLYTGGFYFKNLSWENYNIKLKNQSNNWIQYYVSLSGSEWLRNFSINDSNYWVVSHEYWYYNKKWNIFDDNIVYMSWFSIDLHDILWFSWLDESYSGSSYKIHFNWWWNDINWLFVYTWKKNLSSWENLFIDINPGPTGCSQILKWYYWNPVRWDIVVPIDSDTINYRKWQWFYTNFNLTWALYTNCTSDLSSIYWEIIFDYLWVEMFSLQAGRQYNFTWNYINTWSNLFTKSLQYYSYSWSDFPIWIINDSNYWIWFIWWKLSTWNILSNIVSNINLWTGMNSLISWMDSNKIYFKNIIWWYSDR